MDPVTFPFSTKEYFMKCVKHNVFPSNDFEKQAILLEILNDFEDRVYTEQEADAIIGRYYADFALVRRELISFGYMQRDVEQATYRVVKRILYKEDVLRNTVLAKHAKSFGIE